MGGRNIVTSIQTVFDRLNIRRFDPFPKYDHDITLKSRLGGLNVVTSIAIIVGILLFISETNHFFNFQKHDTVSIDDSNDLNVLVTFKILFFNLPCNDAFIDVIDEENGNSLPTSDQKIKKVETDRYGTPLKYNSDSYPDCMPCSVGNLISRNRLCCSCQAVKHSVRQPKLANLHPLCLRDMLNTTDLHQNEGCEVSGTIRIPRVKGNFHIAAGSKHIDGRHTHSINPNGAQKLKENYRIQHVIKDMRFGPYFTRQSNLLKGEGLFETGLLKRTYFIQLIPTTDESGWFSKKSYQYSYTKHTEVIDVDSDHWHLPGAFFRYDFSPMRVILSKRYSTLTSYLTRLFALVGGIWVVLEIILRVLLKFRNVKLKR